MSQKHDVEKARYWQAVIRDAARSGLSTRAFCRQRKLKECQFYWWQRRLKEKRPPASTPRGPANGPASFALVSDAPTTVDAGIELVLAGGRRLRIAKGVDEPTLRSVLAALERPEC
ncbi:MAG: hypothetical protein ABIF77_11405 [bacterium]